MIGSIPLNTKDKEISLCNLIKKGGDKLVTNIMRLTSIGILVDRIYRHNCNDRYTYHVIFTCNKSVDNCIDDTSYIINNIGEGHIMMQHSVCSASVFDDDTDILVINEMIYTMLTAVGVQ